MLQSDVHVDREVSAHGTAMSIRPREQSLIMESVVSAKIPGLRRDLDTINKQLYD